MTSKDIALGEELSKLETEQRNPRTMKLDSLSTVELIKTLHGENHLVAPAVDPTLDKLSALVDIVVDSMQKGGRLIYVGAGTSGRLGVLDASECPPTFGVTSDTVQGIIAGGEVALVSSIEGAEDDREQPRIDLKARGLSSMDVVVGIAASGRTPYVIGALDYAREVGCATASIVNVGGSALAGHCDICLEAVTGAEPLTGSTRLKAGTAQKMLLNLISTAAMVRMGKVYENLMVDVKATNVKLRKRAIRIVQQATDAPSDKCESALIEVDWHAKTAIVMLLLEISAVEAVEKLEKAGGHIRRAI